MNIKGLNGRMLIFLLDAVFMWTAPAPAWNQTEPGTDTANIQTAVIQALHGSTNVTVRWNYTLLEGQSIRLALFRIGVRKPDMIGNILSPGTPYEDTALIVSKENYPSRFSIRSTSEFSALTINKVSKRENATFQCSLHVGSKIWAYNIRVEVTGRFRERSPLGGIRRHRCTC